MSLYADDMIIYIYIYTHTHITFKTPHKNYQNKQFQQDSRIQDLQKYVAFLYTNNEISQMESKKQSLLKSQKNTYE